MAPALAEQARISPFVKYEEVGTYRLNKNDLIKILIIGYPTPEHFDEIRIGLDGYVNLPYVGSIKLDGLSIDEACTLLTEKLGEYFKEPDLSIVVTEYALHEIYVMGEVSKQGVYELPATSLNVFAAITSAGGITRRGRPKHVTVVRMVGQEIIMREINLDKFIKKQDVEQNIALMGGDMIYVPKSNKVIFNEDIAPIAGMYGLYKTITRD